jgi:hypothetical protein
MSNLLIYFFTRMCDVPKDQKIEKVNKKMK